MRTLAEAWPNISQVLHQYLEKEGKSSSDQEDVPKRQRNNQWENTNARSTPTSMPSHKHTSTTIDG